MQRERYNITLRTISSILGRSVVMMAKKLADGISVTDSNLQMVMKGTDKIRSIFDTTEEGMREGRRLLKIPALVTKDEE